MQGKTVVVTGATSGIGQVAALELAKMGARVVFTARDAARGALTLRETEGRPIPRLSRRWCWATCR